MISLIGLFGFAMCYLVSPSVSNSSANVRHYQSAVAAGLMEQADACAGTSPHRAQELRSAALASLSVVGQR